MENEFLKIIITINKINNFEEKIQKLFEKSIIGIALNELGCSSLGMDSFIFKHLIQYYILNH